MAGKLVTPQYRVEPAWAASEISRMERAALNTTTHWRHATSSAAPAADLAAIEAAVLTVVTDPTRLAAVARLGPLYDRPPPSLERLTRLAADLLEAPVALLTLVDEGRQLFIGSHGLPEPIHSARQTPLQYSVCQYAVAAGGPLVVGDVGDHPFLANHAAVTELGVAAYAGIPITGPDEWAIGALCVIDFSPRDWTDDQLANLNTLAMVCTEQIYGQDVLGRLRPPS
jgi:GAF domain-containing protein